MGAPETTDDVQNLIIMCEDAKIRAFRWGDLSFEFFSEEEDEEEDEPGDIGFSPLMSSAVIDTSADDEAPADGYDKLFGRRGKPTFKKAE